MGSDRLESLLRTPPATPPRRTLVCPDEVQIAAYVDGTLERSDCERLELHLADCDACLALVGLLSRQPEAGIKESVPELAVARARALVKPASSSWTRYAPHWAAAAVVIVALSAVVHFAGLPGDDPRTETEAPLTRTTTPGTPSLQVLYPNAGMTVDAVRLVVRWMEVPGSRYYDVRLVTDSGDLVSEERVEGTEWRPSPDVTLHPGAEYYVHIDAYPSAAKTLSSDHVPFTIAE